MNYVKPVVRTTPTKIKNVEIFALPQGYLHIIIPSSYDTPFSQGGYRVN